MSTTAKCDLTDTLFYEFFNGDSGLGLGASHQTGWTGLVAKLLQQSGAGMTESSYTHLMGFGEGLRGVSGKQC